MLFPAFSRTATDSTSFASLLARSVSGMAVLIVPIFSVIMFFSPEVILFVWGGGLRQADVIMVLLVAAVMFAGLGMPASQALTSTGVRGMATSVRVGVGGFGVGLLVWAGTVPSLGAMGIALGLLAGTLITSALPLILMFRRVQQAWLPHLARGWGVGLTVALAAAVAAHSGIGMATRSGLAALVVVAWLLASRRQVWILVQR